MAEFTEFKIKTIDTYDNQRIDIETIEIKDEDLLEYIQDTFVPEEVFELSDLAEWAEDNGYTKK